MIFAILIAGHIRNYDNIENIINLINLNKEHKFYIFISTKKELNTLKFAHRTKDNNYDEICMFKFNSTIKRLSQCDNIIKVWYQFTNDIEINYYKKKEYEKIINNKFDHNLDFFYGRPEMSGILDTWIFFTDIIFKDKIFFDFIIKTRWDINNNFKLENINIKNDEIYTPPYNIYGYREINNYLIHNKQDYDPVSQKINKNIETFYSENKIFENSVFKDTINKFKNLDLSINNQFALGNYDSMVVYMQVYKFVDNNFNKDFNNLCIQTIKLKNLNLFNYPILCRSHESILKFHLNLNNIKVKINVNWKNE